MCGKSSLGRKNPHTAYCDPHQKSGSDRQSGHWKNPQNHSVYQTYFLQNDALRLGEYTLCGARGWKQRGAENFDAQDEKVFLRELERLKLSIAAAKKIGGRLIGISHYPPFSQNHGRSEFSDLYAEAGVEKVVYGHLHGQRIKKEEYENLCIDGVQYYLTSCDYLDFCLKQIA